jgi:hypothetical protein
MKPKNKCQYFLKCNNEATTSVPHPILKEVPCCQKCKEFYNNINSQYIRQENIAAEDIDFQDCDVDGNSRRS